MVAKIVSRQSIRGLLNYNENKVRHGQAQLIMASRFAVDLDKLDFKAKLQRFEHLTSMNSRVKTNALHIMLNFDKQDSPRLSLLQEIAGKYMDRIGFAEQPYLVYLHKDAHHPHIHIVTTNIRTDGTRMPIHNIGKTLSEAARKEIEKRYNLREAEGRNRSLIPISHIEKAIYGKTPTKRAISNVVTGVLGTYKFTSFAEYNAALSSFGVRADRGREGSFMYEKQGLVYSIIDRSGKQIGIPFKASSLSGKPLLSVVEKKFEANRAKRKTYQNDLKKKIDKVFNRYSSISKATFITELKKSNVDVLFRTNEQGFTYGLTFIGHDTKSVFKGSSLGKEYSAKAVASRLGDSDSVKTYLTAKIATKHFLKNNIEATSKSFTSSLRETNYLESLLGKPQENSSTPLARTRRRKRRRRVL